MPSKPAEIRTSIQRKKYLREVAQDFIAPFQPIFEFGLDADLETAISVVKQTRIEGLVAKRIGSRYSPGIESPHWLKHRFNQEDKFFLGGYIPGPRGIGELLIGEYREGLKSNRVPFVNLPESKGQHQHAVTEEVMAEYV